MAPLVRIAPGRSGVSIWSAPLFGQGDGEHLRKILGRLFSVDEVTEVRIDRSKAYGRVSFAESVDPTSLWRKLSDALSRDEIDESKLSGLRGLSLRMPFSTPIHINRLHNVLSSWRTKRQTKNSISLTHPLLRNRRNIADRLEQEIASVYGVSRVSTNIFSAALTIQFDARILPIAQLLDQLEKALLQSSNSGDTVPSSKRLIAAATLLTVATAGEFATPVLRPVALLGVAAYNFRNVINAARELSYRRIGLPVLYSVGFGLMLWTGLPFNATLMAVLMQICPKLTFRTIRRGERQLFSAQRRRLISARVIDENGREILTDLNKVGRNSVVTVRKGDIVPADGQVIKGMAAVDEEPIFGVGSEGDKTAGDLVYANSTLLDGELTIRVERIGPNTAVAQLSAHLPRGGLPGLPSSLEAERVANRNAAPALFLAFMNLLLARRLRSTQAILRPDYASGPRLSAQLNNVIAVAEALKEGIFIRDPAALDALGAANTYVFDDSIDLMKADLKVGETITSGWLAEDLVLRYAAGAYHGRKGEIADALAAATRNLRLKPVHSKKRSRHVGFTRYLERNGDVIIVARSTYLKSAVLAVPEALREITGEPAADSLWVMKNGELVGRVALRRSETLQAARAIKELHEKNKQTCILLLASRPHAEAQDYAARLGISTVLPAVTSSDRVKALANLNGPIVWIGAPLPQELVHGGNIVSVAVPGVHKNDLQDAQIILFRGIGGIARLDQLARRHVARLRSDYLIVYGANLLGPLGGLAANFGGREAGLVSHAGTLVIFIRRWLEVQRLASKAGSFSTAVEKSLTFVREQPLLSAT